MGYYQEELDRRSRERSSAASRELAEAANSLAQQSHNLTRLTMILSGIASSASLAAVVVSIITLLQTSN